MQRLLWSVIYQSAEVLAITNQNSCNDWILDSWCSFHTYPSRSWFESFTDVERLVFLGNNISCRVTGIGTIRLKMHNGVERILSEVSYVPDLKRNLISLGTLDSCGYTFKSENGILKIQKIYLVVMKGFKKNTLYILQGTTVIDRSDIAHTTSDASKLWQLRLGHVVNKD